MEPSAPSILIIVKGRKDHLLAVIAGIEQSTLAPLEVVIVHMNEPTYAIDSALTIEQVSLETNEPLPLARARNYAAKIAKSENLIFLDVDCIPDETCFAELIDDAVNTTITMVDPRYLKHPVEKIDFAALQADGHRNPVREDLAYGPSTNYEAFWSLGFFIAKTTFSAIGGFDESYEGYGAEDTDFAMSAKRAGVGMYYSRAQVYHQPHPEYDPPLNWLEDIVKNARVYYKKWGEWPMQGWLQAFETSGYIKRAATSIAIVALPTDDAIAHARR